MWLEEHWDHKMMIYDEDPLLPSLQELVPEDLVVVPFNPTAEAMAHYLVETIAPAQLTGTGVTLVSCRYRSTRSSTASRAREDRWDVRCSSCDSRVAISLATTATQTLQRISS